MKAVFVVIALLMFASSAWCEVLFRHAVDGVVASEITTGRKHGQYAWFFDGENCVAAVVIDKPTVFVQCQNSGNMLMSRHGKLVRVSFQDGSQSTYGNGTIFYAMFSAIAKHYKR